MEQQIKNKVAVITGAARGLGFAIAEEILKEGAKTVIAIDMNAETGSDAVNKLNTKYGKNKAIFIKADVTKDLDETFKNIIDQYKIVDILVNNAGICDENDIRRIIAVNSTAVIEWSAKFFEHMTKLKGGNGGTILNMSSMYGYKVDECLPVYKATKFSVMGFSKTLGHVKNYEYSGVRVVALCPGYTYTEILNELKPSEVFYIADIVHEDYEKQDAKDVGKAAVEVIAKVPTGTAWNIIAARPIEEV